MISIIKGYKASGQLLPRVVLQIGNNGPLYSADMDEMRKLLAGVEHVYLINDRVPRSWESESNQAIAEAAQSWPNAELLNWHDLAAHNGNLTFDGIHLTPQGDHVYSHLIYDAVNKDAPPPPPGLLGPPST
jgi:lysophospholipase L1-like esterase